MCKPGLPHTTLNPESFYPFTFDQIQLKEACWINDEPCFTRRAIGEWLGYSRPQKAIDKIIERNPYIDQFSQTIKLLVSQSTGERTVHPQTERCVQEHSRQSDGYALEHKSSGKASVPDSFREYAHSQNGQNYTREIEQHVYNPIGLQLIVFESRQPKARAYKILVANLVYAFMKGELKPPRSIADLRLQADCEAAARLRPYYERPEAYRRIAEKHGVSMSTIARWVKEIEAGKNPADKPYGKHLKGKRHYICDEDVKKIEQIAAEAPWMSVKDIISMLPRVDYSAKATVARIKRAVKNQIKQRIINKLESTQIHFTDGGEHES